MSHSDLIQLPQQVISYNNLKLAFKRTLKINDDLIIDHLNVDKAQGRNLMAQYDLSPTLYRYLCVKAMRKDLPIKVRHKIPLEGFKVLQHQVNQAVKDYLVQLHQSLQSGWLPQDSISIAEPKANYTERIKVRLCLDDAVVYQALANVILPKVYDKLAQMMNITGQLSQHDYDGQEADQQEADQQEADQQKSDEQVCNTQDLKPKLGVPYQVLSNHLEPISKLGEVIFEAQNIEKKQMHDERFTYHCFQNYYPHWQAYESFYRGGPGSPKLKDRFLLKVDFTAFYDCINHERLFAILRDHFEISIEICTALKAGFYRWQRVDQSLLPGVGLPQGYLASSLLSECYLYPFDLAMQNLAQQGYLIRRYVDDIAIITANHARSSQGLEGLNTVINQLAHYARSLGLHLNQSKLQTIQLKPWQMDLEVIEESNYQKNMKNIFKYMQLAKAFNSLDKGKLKTLLKTDAKLNTGRSIIGLSKDIQQIVSEIKGLNNTLDEAIISELLVLQEYYLHSIIPLFKSQNALYYEGWLGSRGSSKSKRDYDLFLFKLEKQAVALQKVIETLYLKRTDSTVHKSIQSQWQIIQDLYSKFLNQSGLSQLEQAQREKLEVIKANLSPEAWRSWTKTLLNALRRRSYYHIYQGQEGDSHSGILLSLARHEICQVGASLRLLNRYPHTLEIINEMIDIARKYERFEGVRYAIYEHLSDVKWVKNIKFTPIFNKLLAIESNVPSTIGFMGLVELAYRQDIEDLTTHLYALKASNEHLLNAVSKFVKLN